MFPFSYTSFAPLFSVNLACYFHFLFFFFRCCAFFILSIVFYHFFIFSRSCLRVCCSLPFLFSLFIFRPTFLLFLFSFSLFLMLFCLRTLYFAQFLFPSSSISFSALFSAQILACLHCCVYIEGIGPLDNK